MSAVTQRRSSAIQRRIKTLSDTHFVKTRNVVGGPYIVLKGSAIDDLDIWKVSSRTDDGFLDYGTVTAAIKTLAAALEEGGLFMRLHHVVRGDAPGNEKASLHHVGLAFDFSVSDRNKKYDALVQRLVSDIPFNVAEFLKYDGRGGRFYHVGLKIKI